MQIINPNQETVKVYNDQMDLYLQHTPSDYNISHAPLISWIQHSLNLIPRNGSILEIGSGPGRDAKFIRQMGYSILCSDASQAFVNHLHQLGQNAIKLDVLNDNIQGTYDMVFANAVFPHFTPSDVGTVLKKIHHILKPGGILAFSAKEGEGEAWITEKLHQKRFVHYWKPTELVEIGKKFGFEIEFMQDEIPGDLPGHVWILMTFIKK